MENSSKVLIVDKEGGMLGEALKRELKRREIENFVDVTGISDLKNREEVDKFFVEQKPEYVFLVVSREESLVNNESMPVDFFVDNNQVQCNFIHNAHLHQVKKLIFLASSHVYPKYARQPIKEEYLMTGKLDEHRESLALAKINGIKLCEFYQKEYGDCFFAVIGTDVYGVGDDFDLDRANVVPALIRKFKEAKEFNKPFVVLWGSGEPKRDFMSVEDLANGLVHIMNVYDGKDGHINLGTGSEVSIANLAELVKKISGYVGEIRWDKEKPDGAPRRLLDVYKSKDLGWYAKTSLEVGLKEVYNNYIGNL
jgi:GDP-L-fucose synthase